MRGCARSLKTLFIVWLAGCATAPSSPDAGGDALASRVHVDGVRTECEVLDPGDHGCLLPWPSSRFQDATTHVITLPSSRTPANVDGVHVRTEAWDGHDGYSPMTTMMARIEGAIDSTTLPGWRDIDASLASTSPTVLLDATDPAHVARVAHFAEPQQGGWTLDTSSTPPMSADDTPPTTLYVRPAARLVPQHHYVVGILVRRADGTQPASSPSFAALRDGAPTDSSAVEARRASFEQNVFAPLAAAGIARGGLVIAWDFWTGSDHHAYDDLVAMRDQAFALDAITPLGCSVDAVTTDATGMRQVTGTFDVPYFLNATDTGPLIEVGCMRTGEIDAAGEARLVRDSPTAAPHLPMTGRTRRSNFVALVPMSVVGSSNVRLVEYGHGLLNDRTEIAMPAGVVAPVLEASHTIGVATDAYGLTRCDTAAIVTALMDLGRFSSITDRILQGVIAQVVLPHVFATACAAEFSAHPEITGTSIDTSHFGWIGNSQGAIVGPTVGALEPRFDRLALGVGGISYPIMMPRSTDWPLQLAPLLRGAYPDRIDRDLLMVMFSSHWDRFEGATFAPQLLHPMAPFGSTSRSVLYQIARDDMGTPEVSGEIAARTIGLQRMPQSATTPSGLEPVPVGNTPTSAFVSYAYDHQPVAPTGTDTPPLDVCTQMDPCQITHELVRRDPRAQAQIVDFLVTGTVVNHCDSGACSGPRPSSPACP